MWLIIYRHTQLFPRIAVRELLLPLEISLEYAGGKRPVGKCSRGVRDLGVIDGGVGDFTIPLLLKGKGSQEYIVLFGGGLMQTR